MEPCLREPNSYDWLVATKIYIKSGLTEEEKDKKRKKLKLYKQYKEMAEAMGDGTTVEDIRRNMKKMLKKAKTSKDLVFDEDGNIKILDAKDLIDQTARSVMSRLRTGKSLGDDLTQERLMLIT